MTRQTRIVSLCLLSFLFLIAQANAQTNIYFFTMDGCGPCKQMEPQIDLLISKGYPVKKIDARLQNAWAQQFQVSTTPTTIVVDGNRIIKRQSGILDAATIASWVNSIEQSKRSVAVAETRTKAQPTAVANRSANTNLPNINRKRFPPANADYRSETMHEGTRTPRTEAERIAMQATVRIRIEDAEGFSFATGTVIHSHGDEALVLTCGHAFRDSKGQGEITAELNWLDEETIRVPGQLISYDADANDVGLIVIKAGREIPAVKLASNGFRVTPGDDIFSIGCDLGKPPTIRHSKIKNLAVYDGANKYDIFGRPVVGRSGGGLFTSSGYLIGVCNAAAVEVDEGVFSAIDNIQHEIAKSNLNHLFGEADAIASSSPPPSAELLAFAESVKAGASDLQAPVNRALPTTELLAGVDRANQLQSEIPFANNVGYDQPLAPIHRNNVQPNNSVANSWGEYEAVVVVKSKTNPNDSRTIVVSDLTPELLEAINAQSQTSGSNPKPNPRDFAQLRNEMPDLRNYEARDNSQTLRGQSRR
ncbi:MAG: trypsin-like peptidase domain-containing protein [Pirellulaceae bacterium]